MTLAAGVVDQKTSSKRSPLLYVNHCMWSFCHWNCTRFGGHQVKNRHVNVNWHHSSLSLLLTIT